MVLSSHESKTCTHFHKEFLYMFHQTDFYITLPKDNLETALWLESDRMEGLDITPEKLETEKRVVI